MTPLSLASQFGHIAVAELLVRQGVDVNIQDNVSIATVADFAVNDAELK